MGQGDIVLWVSLTMKWLILWLEGVDPLVTPIHLSHALRSASSADGYLISSYSSVDTCTQCLRWKPKGQQVVRAMRAVCMYGWGGETCVLFTSFGNDAHRGHELAFMRGGESVIDPFLHGLHVVAYRRIGVPAGVGTYVWPCRRRRLSVVEFFPLLYMYGSPTE